MAAASESTLVIKELTGQKRSVTLRGPSLPFQGAGWGGSLRTDTTWYPGNSAEGTTHVLVAVEKPSQWMGVWRLTMLNRVPAQYSEGGSPQDVVHPADLRDILEAIYRGGQRLRVEWQNRNRVLVREGRATDWDFDHERVEDIEWSVTFEWVSRGARQQKVATRRKSNVGSALDQMAIELAKLANVANVLETAGKFDPDKFNDFSLDDLDNLLDVPTDLVANVAQVAKQITGVVVKVGDIAKKARAIPSAIANQALDVANNAVAVVNQFNDDMSRRPPEANSASMKVSQLTKATEYLAGAQDDADAVGAAAQQLATQVRRQAEKQSDILAIHVVRGGPSDQATRGEALANISQRYYQTVEYAAGIAVANNLPLNQTWVPVGTILIIPVVDVVKGFTPTNP